VRHELSFTPGLFTPMALRVWARAPGALTPIRAQGRSCQRLGTDQRPLASAERCWRESRGRKRKPMGQQDCSHSATAAPCREWPVVGGTRSAGWLCSLGSSTPHSSPPPGRWARWDRSLPC
jgi:hypothetical protein